MQLHRVALALVLLISVTAFAGPDRAAPSWEYAMLQVTPRGLLTYAAWATADTARFREGTVRSLLADLGCAPADAPGSSNSKLEVLAFMNCVGAQGWEYVETQTDPVTPVISAGAPTPTTPVSVPSVLYFRRSR